MPYRSMVRRSTKKGMVPPACEKMNLMLGQRCAVPLNKMLVMVRVVSVGGANSGLFQAMAKTLDGDFTGLKFELNNAAKDLRYYCHLTESVKAPSVIGSNVHQALNLAAGLGYGSELVPSLVKAQYRLNGLKIGEN